MGAPRVFILGLDGATLDLLRPWAAQGLLPAFARLFAGGVSGPLRSTIQPHTAPAWTSVMSGVNPGGHGVYDFIERVPGSYQVRLTHGVLRRVRTMWSVAGDQGLRVGVVNVPMTYPPEPVNGFMISGIDAPGVDAPFVHPPELLADLHREVGGYVIALNAPDLDGWAAAVQRMAEVRIRAVRYLLATRPWDVFMVVFQSTDMAQHLFWTAMADGADGPRPDPQRPHGDVLYRVYRRIDDLLGELLDSFGEETVLLALSDHGAGPLRKVVYVNRLLADLGLLAVRREAHQRLLRRAVRGGLMLGKRYLPAGVKGLLKYRAGGMRDAVESFLTETQYEWRATRAFALGIYGNLFFNVRGREPEGALDPADVPVVTRAITDALLALRDPDTGAPVVERVYPRAELYHGPYLDRAPDLIIQWRGYEYDCRARFAAEEDKLFGDVITFSDLSYQPMTAVHRLHGFIALRGAMVPAGRQITGATLLDVAPTVLYLLGAPIPAAMEGRVLTDALDEDWVRRQGPPRRVEGPTLDGQDAAGYTPEEAQAIRDRLHGLGYL